MDFRLVSDYQPRGDQGNAIRELVAGARQGDPHQVLLGVTGSGKTFTMAKVIEPWARTALVMAHNKTLAAQLYHEFRSSFPRTRSNISSATTTTTSRRPTCRPRDLYIEKDATINEELDKLRLSATRSLFERRDCVIVASRLLHLRPGLAGGLLRHAADAGEGAEDPARGDCSASWWKSSTSATT